MFGAVECDGVQLLHVKNPWIVKEGTIEWTGDWCDTSAKWSEYPSVAAACGFTVTWSLCRLWRCVHIRGREKGGGGRAPPVLSALLLFRLSVVHLPSSGIVLIIVCRAVGAYRVDILGGGGRGGGEKGTHYCPVTTLVTSALSVVLSRQWASSSWRKELCVL